MPNSQQNHITSLISFIIIAMLSLCRSSRAFSTVAVKKGLGGGRAAVVARGGRQQTQATAVHLTALKTNPSPLSSSSSMMLRMSSTSSPDTSIVDVCQQKIQDALQTTDVKVTGAYDDPNGSHISIEVTSSLFEGKRAVQRQQLVYKAIWEELQGPVHAVDAMICKTPDE
mmetsp:Transcript_42756/g.103189  ORF Transcript_42756/g.103189 Transcript_42756/m.103189 type:complete len:170 (-) Transcript_42756:2441-2950(-)